MTQEVLNILKNLDIPIEKCYGQGYDGTSVMSGAYNGKRPTLDRMFASTSQRNDDGLRASYNNSLLIAKSGKPHTIGKKLILSAVEDVLHKPTSDIIKRIPLSNNTVERGIDEMSSDIENFLCNYLQTTHFSIQLDESTLPDNAALLLAYVRFIMNQEIYEELVFARTLITVTKGESVFHVLKDYFIEKAIPLSNIISVATDGAPAMKRPTLDRMFASTLQRNDDGLRASYDISLLIAKSGKPHTSGENSILPAVEEVLKTVLHKPASDIIRRIPLSNNTVERRIDEMSSDIESFLSNYLQTTHFSIQLDELTLPDNAALLLAYVRFIMNQEIYEELVFARTLITDTKDNQLPSNNTNIHITYFHTCVSLAYQTWPIRHVIQHVFLLSRLGTSDEVCNRKTKTGLLLCCKTKARQVLVLRTPTSDAHEGASAQLGAATRTSYLHPHTRKE
ncbi:unnamed protein product [Acanthoscelides obtectus]|uniref:DUF4371 domain-containing protein n=1 Tax=Acanthoscelides obtectus TaxID=200917 RepID=A0A9P0M1M4_ACAOB|nr:unnamed protein product [Acanthoscelides obtectus]CAK1619934.1 Protein ZBED8 [Acanthoscelides obtectus]